MFGVASKIAIDPVTHVDQFLGDDDFEGTRPREIEASQIDENEMVAGPGVIRVGSPNG